MSSPIVCLAIYFFEMLISYLFFSKIAEKYFLTPKQWLFALLCFESAAVANLIFSNTIWVNLVSFCIANILFAIFGFRLKASIAIFYSFILTAFMSALEIVSIFSISVLAGSHITDYNTNVILLFFDVIISKSLYLITCFILVRFIKNENTQCRFPIGLYMYPAGIFVCLTIFWYICAQQELSYINQCLLVIVSIILFGSTITLFITYQHSLERENEYVKVESAYKQLQIEKSYYEILEYHNRQLMLYAHDAKNHLAAIQSLSENPCVNSYIEKLSGQLNKYVNHCDSGNHILDVIINKYVVACELKNIKFEYDVCLCNLTGIEDFDLVTILGNLLDNAIDSAQQSKVKKISISTAFRNSYCIIVIENSCDTPPVICSNKLVTTKRNGRLHGLGLQSVAKSLKRYQGDFDWEYDSANSIFIVTVMLKTKG